MCNDCIFGYKKEMPALCNEIVQRYDISKKIRTEHFILSKPYLKFNTTIFYPTCNELIDYEDEGLQILMSISSKSLTAEQIGKILNIEPNLVYRFLIQEKSKNHI